MSPTQISSVLLTRFPKHGSTTGVSQQDKRLKLPIAKFECLSLKSVAKLNAKMRKIYIG